MSSKRILSIAIAIVGLVLIIYPLTSGVEAYKAGENFYVGEVDSIQPQYKDYVKKKIQEQLKIKGALKRKLLRQELDRPAFVIDSLILEAKTKRNSKRLDSLNVLKQALVNGYELKKIEIDEKYDTSALSTERFNALYDSVSNVTDMIECVVWHANKKANPNNLDDIKKFSVNDITIKKVNKQDKGPFILAGVLIVVTALFIFLFDEGVIQLHMPLVKYMFIIAFGALVIVMAIKSWNSVGDLIEFQEEFEARKEKVQEHLLNVRSLQLTYYEEKGEYSKDWNKLIDFAKNDSAKYVKYLVNKDDTAAVNNALRLNLPLEDTTYVPVKEKCFEGNIIDIDALPIVPFSKDTFELNAGSTDRNGRTVHLFEVKTNWRTFVKNLGDKVPENFPKDKEVILGSMKEATTEGNW